MTDTGSLAQGAVVVIAVRVNSLKTPSTTHITRIYTVMYTATYVYVYTHAHMHAHMYIHTHLQLFMNTNFFCSRTYKAYSRSHDHLVTQKEHTYHTKSVTKMEHIP